MINEGVESFVLRVRYFPAPGSTSGLIRIMATQDPKPLTQLGNRLLKTGVVREIYISIELIKTAETTAEKHVAQVIIDAMNWREYKGSN